MSRWFKLIPTGFGDFWLVPYDIWDEPQAFLYLGVVALIMLAFLLLIKDIMLIPLVFLLLIIGVAFSFGLSNALSPLIALAFPLFVYGYESFLWGLFGPTSRDTIGLMAWLFWIAAIMVPVVIGAVLSEEHFILGFIGYGYFGFVWIAPFLFSGSNDNKIAFKHIFTLTYILTLALTVALFVLKNKDAKKTSIGVGKGLVLDLISFALGFVPLIVANLFSGANQYVVLVLVLIAYAGGGFVIRITYAKFKSNSQDSRPSVGPIMLPFTYMILFIAHTEFSEECIVPYGFIPALTDMFNNDFTTSCSVGIMNAVKAVNEIVCGILYLIISLIGKLFDFEIKNFSMPLLLAFVFAFALIVFLLGIASGLLKIGKKAA